MILGELWNVDIWFFDNETIMKAEEFCNLMGVILYNGIRIYGSQKNSS